MLSQKLPQFTLIGLGVLLLSFVLVLEAWHVTIFRHAFGYGLHADLVQREADIGIPGIRTLYVVRIFNYGLLPRDFEGVQLPGGYIGSGVVYRSEIERWNEQTRAWEKVVQPDPSDWKAFPRTRTRIWPGRSIYAAGWQAVAAVNGIKKGDVLRLTVFRGFDRPIAGEQESAVNSPAFKVEEQRISVSFFGPAMSGPRVGRSTGAERGKSHACGMGMAYDTPKWALLVNFFWFRELENLESDLHS